MPHDVIIAGGGPTGLMLAAELKLAGVDVVVVERRATQELAGSRAGGLHARTIEVLDMRGIADRFLAAGTIAQVAAFNLVKLDISDFPTPHPYGLALFQNRIERLLADWTDELGVSVVRSTEVAAFTQDDDGVDVALSDGRTLRAQYLVGCDGGRSTVRKAAGIDFVGSDATISWILAEVETTETPAYGIREDTFGAHIIGRTDGPQVRIVINERAVGSGEAPTLDEVKAALVEIYGTDFGVHSPVWLSRFTDATRQAVAYRDRRVLLAGDAAHVHAPIGGQGLNIGVQDAVNLGWKLAQVVRGQSPDALLDTYHAERHPVAARVLENTLAQSVLRRRDDRWNALGRIVGELLTHDSVRMQLGAEMSGLGVRYDLGDGHPLLGRRMPDLALTTAFGVVRVFTLLRDAQPLLLNLGGPRALAIDGWVDRVPSIAATYDGPWELPAIGAVPAPAAVLVRPDGYVAWVGDGSDAGLADALAQWFGPPAT